MHKKTDGQINRQKIEWTDEWTNRQMEGESDGQSQPMRSFRSR